MTGNKKELVTSNSNINNNNYSKTPAKIQSKPFEERHRQDFQKSGIDDATVYLYIDKGYLESHADHWKLFYPELIEDKKSDYYTIRFDNPPIDENGKEQGKYKRLQGQTSRIFRPIGLKPEILKNVNEPLFITEGEKKAIKAVQEGYNCIALAGVYCYFDPKNSDDRLIPNMHAIDWHERIVYLVFDNDMWIKPQVEKALLKLSMILISRFKVKVKVLSLPDYSEVNKKIGLDDFLKDYGKAAFDDLVTNAEEMTLEKAKALLKKEDRIHFPIETLPKKIKNFALNASEVMDAPIEFIACSIIAGAAILVNSKAKVMIKSDWLEPCILWTMIVAKPGKQVKSPSIKLITKFINEFDELKVNKYKEDKEQYSQNFLVYEKQLKNWKKEKNDSITPLMPEEPIRELIYTSDTTKESLIELQKKNSSGIAIINDEISSFLRGFNQYKSGGGNDEQYFLSAWSSDRHITTRKGDKEPTTITPCHNILGTTQPSEVETLIFKDIKSTNGLAERWLFVVSDHVQSGKVNRKVVEEDLKDAVKTKFKELSEMAETIVVLSPESQQIFDEYHEILTKESQNDKNPELLQSYLVKQKGYTARLALVLHCLEHKNKPEITAETMIKAIKLSRFYIDCFKRVSKVSLEMKSNKHEAYVLELIKTKQMTEISPSFLHKQNRSRIKSTEDAKAVLENLADQGHGYIVPVANGIKLLLF